MISGGGFSIKLMLRSLIPSNYFVILYSAVYILSPFINVVFANISRKQLRMLLRLSVLLFSFYPTFVDVLSEFAGKQLNGLSTIGMYGSQWGYSIVNFMLMYMVGAYIRLGEPQISRYGTKRLLALISVCVGTITLWTCMNDRIGYITEKSAWEYCNPVVIFLSALIFILFSRLNLGVNQFINRLAEGVFSIFLLHSMFLPYIGIEKAVHGNAIVMLGHIILSVPAIGLACLAVHYVYAWITKPIYRKLKRRIRLPLIGLDA